MQDYGYMTPEQRAWQEELERRQLAHSRDVCAAFAFWRDCEQRRCTRERACSGDPHACSSRGWARMPEDHKVWFRAAVKAMAAGASSDGAARIADTEVERWRACEAEVAQLFKRAAKR